MIKDRFSWITIDAQPSLPPNWSNELTHIAESAPQRHISTDSVTSRESTCREGLELVIIDGTSLSIQVPWLVDLYLTTFRKWAEEAFHTTVVAASDIEFGITLNVQRGKNMRYECHVDTNPIQALLYATSHDSTTGGELVVARNQGAQCIEEVDADAVLIYPNAGYFVMFDARLYPHYVRPLTSQSGLRAVAAMSYYTVECSEAMRPADLKEHLFGKS